MTLRLRLLAVLCVATVFASAEPIKRITQPAISPDGLKIAFSWQGDIWTVSRAGGRAERLTIHPAVDNNPHWTPDSKRIVFASNRYGGFNVFSMAEDGTDLKRLTFDSATTVPTAVTPDGRYVVGYSAAFTAMRGNLFRVPITGGDLVQLTDHPFEGTFSATVTPDGKHVIYDRGGYGITAWQKPGVKSSAMPNIFVADNSVPLHNQHPLSRSESTQMFPTIDKNAEITYVSNDSGWPNIWRMHADGTAKRRLSDHHDGTIRYASTSADGRYVAYDFESELYLLDTETKTTHAITVDVPDDARNNPVQELNLTSGVDDYAIAPDGKRAVIALRGDLFLIPEKGGTTRRLTTNPAWDGQPVFLDNKKILYVASQNDKRVLVTCDLASKTTPFLSDDKDLTHPILSPDGKSVAYLRGIDEILIVPAAGGAPKSILKGEFASALFGNAPFSWSPDNKWLLVDKPTDRGSSEVTACEVTGSRHVIVARTAHGVDGAPRFLPNGKGVYFVTAEYAERPDLFLVDLVPQEITFSEDDLDKIDDKPGKKSDSVAVEIQEAGLERRMRRLTRSGDVGSVMAQDGKSLYAVIGGVLNTVAVTTGAAKPVDGAPAGTGDLHLGPNGSKLYWNQGGKLAALTLERGAVNPISFNAVYTINLRDEEKALFSEIWWGMDRIYYDTTMHGKNWKAIEEKFAKIVPYCYDRTDFYALMGEMMEELDSSHLGSTAPPVPSTGGTDSTAYLGVVLDPVALDQRNVYIVRSVDADSPADQPQSKLLPGDRILAVDGIEPANDNPLAALLNKKTGKKVVLKIERAGLASEVVIKPASSATQRELAYQNWVTWERTETERLSHGALTYLHVRGMDDASFAEFLREIRTRTPGKKGVLIDVRYNGGGSTSHKLLGVLIKTPWLLRTTRGPEGLRISENIYRGDSLELPTALLFNTYSFSNAEIMGEGFRRLKLGPIIGERTPGYVIGTGAMGLWDGGAIRTPEIGCYAIDGTPLENDGRRPDFNVWFDPDAWSAGRDPQLEKAVQELLRNL